MGRSVAMLAWCDVCLGEQVKRPAEHAGVSISINGATPLYVDLCEEHHEQLVRPALELVRHHGSVAVETLRTWRPKPNRLIGPYRCLVPGCLQSPLKNSDTLQQHVRLHHDITLGEYKDQYGELMPMTEEEQASFVAEARCELEGCGKVYSTELGHRWPASALKTHMWSTHAIKT